MVTTFYQVIDVITFRFIFFFFNDTATTEIYTLSLHDALPILADAYSFGRELSGGLYRYLGFVVEAEGLRIYHAGDTLADEELQDRLARLAPDVALLPVNGRDHYREAQNIVGNMGPREAVSFATTVGAGLLVPMHYDMFPINLGYPAHLVDFAGRHHQDVAIMLPSRRRPFVC